MASAKEAKGAFETFELPTLFSSSGTDASDKICCRRDRTSKMHSAILGDSGTGAAVTTKEEVDLEEESISCSVCNVKIQSLVDLSEHNLTEHQEDKEFHICPVCHHATKGFFFKDFFLIYRHFLISYKN